MRELVFDSPIARLQGAASLGLLAICMCMCRCLYISGRRGSWAARPMRPTCTVTGSETRVRQMTDTIRQHLLAGRIEHGRCPAGGVPAAHPHDLSETPMSQDETEACAPRRPSTPPANTKALTDAELRVWGLGFSSAPSAPATRQVQTDARGAPRSPA